MSKGIANIGHVLLKKSISQLDRGRSNSVALRALLIALFLSFLYRVLLVCNGFYSIRAQSFLRNGWADLLRAVGEDPFFLLIRHSHCWHNALARIFASTL
jgi:hypothetical protein